MKSRKLRVKDQPSIVEFLQTNVNFVYGYIDLEIYGEDGATELSKATKLILDLGFEYNCFTYNIGYYDAIEDKKLEYHLYDEDKIKKFLENTI